jgi:hypothetical protein
MAKYTKEQHEKYAEDEGCELGESMEHLIFIAYEYRDYTSFAIQQCCIAELDDAVDTILSEGA